MLRKGHLSPKLIIYLIPLILFIFLSCSSQEVEMDEMEFAGKQLKTALKEIEKVRLNHPKLLSPRSLRSDTLFMVKPSDWTSGFFAGNLWWMYEATGEDFWKGKAMQFTTPIESMKDFKGTHDLGFMFYCSFGKGYQLTGNEEFKMVMLDAANALTSRFDPNVGAIRSWDFNSDTWQFPVIIDNMINLEFLFWATKATGDSTYYKVADAHAETTFANHFRENYSSYHVIDYDTLTGEVKNKHTHQGYAHDSSWSRGQAWALYGYVMCYRETGKEKYLELAERIAKLMLEHPNMPEDLVPYWDYDAPDIPNAPRDASAAAIMASAMFELDNYLPGNDRFYKRTANQVLDNLTASYRSGLGENKGFILIHSTGHLPDNHEIDVPLVYADYYYLEALQRRNEVKFTSDKKF